MFYALLGSTFAIALAVSWLTCRLFQVPADRILHRILQDDIYRSWLTYLKFALYVVGISSGVRIYQLERFVSKPAWNKDGEILTLTGERWILETYRTIIDSLQGLAGVLLIFFLVALAAFVVVKLTEAIRRNRAEARA